MAKSPEHAIQVALIHELRYRLRPAVISFAIPNGGHRHIGVAKKLKAEGVLAGMPDLGFAVEDGRTHWIEMKAPGGDISDNQEIVRDRLIRLGHNWAMAKSVEEALEHLDAWKVLR
jgi:VRR-NUC domain